MNNRFLFHPFLRIAILFTGMVLTSVYSHGQACPSIDAGNDTIMDCDSTCITLTATVAPSGATTSYTVQQIPYIPFSYTTGTSILLNIDDQWSSVLNIGFDFCFYSGTYNQLVIGSNGLISFDLSNANSYCQWPISAPIPSVSNPTNSIMAPFHDTDPSVGGVIRWSIQGTPPCRKFIVSWYQVPMFSCNNLISTQQAVLYETTNVIETYILNKPLCSGWNSGAAIHGLHDATGTQATVVPGRNYPTQWSASNDAYRFIPAGPSNWVVNWYDMNNTLLGSNLSQTVCPTQTSSYIAEAIYTNCNSAQVIVTDTVTVFRTSNFTPQMDSIMVTCNGACDGQAWGFADQDSSTAPWTYNWFDGNNNLISTTNSTFNISDTIFTLCPDTYLLQVIDSVGCIAYNTVIVTEPPPLVLTDTNVADVLCNGDCTGQATVIASGGTPGYTYLWPDNSANATNNNLCATTHQVTVTDNNSCTETIDITINEPPPIVITVGSLPASCGQADGSIWASATGGVSGFTYQWSNGCNTDSCNGVITGAYTVTVTDSSGCTETMTVNVGEINSFTIQVNTKDVSCPGDCDGAVDIGIVGGSAPFTYAWSTGETTEDINTLCIGQYDVTVTDNKGCTEFLSTAVGIGNPDPIADFVADPNPTNIRETDISFYDNSEGNIVQWSWTFYDIDGKTILGGANIQNPLFTLPPDTGVYCVDLEVITDAGCIDDTMKCILVDGIYHIFVPNAFTPNGDGLNDYFFPQGIGINEESGFEFMVFDRWGEVIFVSNNINNKWDGTAPEKGGKKLVPQGVYIWKLKTKEITRKGYAHEYIGHVAVVR